MKLYKLGIMLCLAYSNSDGPFKVKITYYDHIELETLSKIEIDFLSDIKEVLVIDIVDPQQRRWRDRGTCERRNYWRII